MSYVIVAQGNQIVIRCDIIGFTSYPINIQIPCSCQSVEGAFLTASFGLKVLKVFQTIQDGFFQLLYNDSNMTPFVSMNNIKLGNQIIRYYKQS